MASKRKATPGKKKNSRTTKKKPAAGFDGAREFIRTTARHASRVFAGLVLAAIAVAWLLGHEPLQRHVGAMQSDQLVLRFIWPSAPQSTPGDAPSDRQTWIPEGVRFELEQIVSESVSRDPFDQASLERARRRLHATGWIDDVTVRRHPAGIVEITGQWRKPAGVVEKSGQSYLVGFDGAPMLIPTGASLPRGLYRLYNPYAEPPRNEDGTLALGQPWRLDDVRDAIELLRHIAPRRWANQVVGIDLSEYWNARTNGQLVIVTDTGSKIVWGAPFGRRAPGQVPCETRLARLQRHHDRYQHIDAGQRRLDIYTDPYVLIDKTARAQPAELAERNAG